MERINMDWKTGTKRINGKLVKVAEQERKRYNYRMNKIYNLYIKKKGCYDCKKVFPMHIYEFDHVGSTRSTRKYNSIRLLFRHSLKKLFKEMKLGHWICANCHKDRTYKRKNI